MSREAARCMSNRIAIAIAVSPTRIIIHIFYTVCPTLLEVLGLGLLENGLKMPYKADRYY